MSEPLTVMLPAWAEATVAAAAIAVAILLSIRFIVSSLSRLDSLAVTARFTVQLRFGFLQDTCLLLRFASALSFCKKAVKSIFVLEFEHRVQKHTVLIFAVEAHLIVARVRAIADFFRDES